MFYIKRDTSSQNSPKWKNIEPLEHGTEGHWVLVHVPIICHVNTEPRQHILVDFLKTGPKIHFYSSAFHPASDSALVPPVVFCLCFYDYLCTALCGRSLNSINKVRESGVDLGGATSCTREWGVPNHILVLNDILV